MEATIGIRGADFVLLASDRNAARSIVVMKSDEIKSRNLGKSVAMAFGGDPGSSVRFAEYVQANVRLNSLRNEYEGTAQMTAHYTRRILADALRTREAYSTNLLIGGFGGKTDESDPKLFWIDHMASLVELPFAAHGHAAYFVLSLMDKHYRPGMSLAEGMDLLRMCLLELKTRYLVNLPQFSVKIIKASGIEDIVISA